MFQQKIAFINLQKSTISANDFNVTAGDIFSIIKMLQSMHSSINLLTGIVLHIILPPLLIKLFAVIPRLPTNAMHLVLLVKLPSLAIKFWLVAA